MLPPPLFTTSGTALPSWLLVPVSAAEPYLSRINRGLRSLGIGVSLELTPNGQRIRLRATMPTRAGSWTRQRVSTRMGYPGDVEDAKALAEALEGDLRLARLGQPFPFERWTGARQTLEGERISGREALALTESWWRERRRRPGGDDSWRVDYQQPLQPLLGVETVTAATLRDVVLVTAQGTRTRQRAANAAAAVAQALAMPVEMLEELRTLGRGYSPKDAAPREPPADAVIEAVIDGLPDGWQWVAGVCATYGTRPHEALLAAELQPSGLLAVRGGKTGARQALPLPKAWVERWDLARKRLPAVDLSRGNKQVGTTFGIALRKRGAPFKGYDLRHAWAVRAIHNPAISPSLAARSMGHSLMMHATMYERWFDQQSMVGVLASL